MVTPYVISVAILDQGESIQDSLAHFMPVASVETGWQGPCLEAGKGSRGVRTVQKLCECPPLLGVDRPGLHSASRCRRWWHS